MEPLEVASKALIALQRLFFVVIASAFGLGGYLTAIYSDINALQSSVSNIERELLGDVNQRLRRLEASVDSGTLPMSDKRLDRLEAKVFGTPLVPSDGRDQ